MPITYRDTSDLPREGVLALYGAIGWSAAKKPDELMRALAGSDVVYSAWDGDRLIGIANALTDGHLVVYYPHILVLPDYQGRGVGRRLLDMLQARYAHLHQQILVAEADSTGFYERAGFTRAGDTVPMWKYDGDDHG